MIWFFIVAQALSAGCAVAAAVYWFQSARVETPERFSVHVSKPDGFMGEPLGGNPLGGTFVGTAHSSDFKALAEALKRQSKMNAIGARFASGAAILQAVAIAERLISG